ncbi:hypothetical protein RSSL_00480 [Streptococcus salivarius K12]|uniref:Glycosyltransferase RgtA/B/C/D-like domain-containing protein n=2 Tax=Streptococcus salivarius TaxID=1304 RepID=J7TU02_STRSL|nr:hypothetical protein RSSL_00480 [Streptococcus salivarius K12]
MNKIYNSSKLLMYLWSTLLLALLTLSSVFYRTILLMDGSEFAYIHRNSFMIVGISILSVILFFILLRFIIKLPSKIILLLGTIFYLVLGIYLIIHQNDILRHDALEVYKSAKNLNQLNYSSLKQLVGYLYKYPHQIGLVTFERVLLFIFGSNNIKALFFVNLILCICDNFLLFKITESLFSDSNVNKILLVLSFLFLPHIFFILFVYGINYGLFLVLLSLFFLIRFIDDKKWINLVGTLIPLVLAVIIRSNYIIMAMTIFIILILDFLRTKSWKNILLAILPFILISLLNGLLVNSYEKASKISEIDGEPKIAWVAMGLDDNPTYNRLPGWYDAYVENVYTKHNGNEDKITNDSKKLINSRLNTFLKNPGYTVNFFKNKFISTWTDSLFQSVWSGPNSSMPVEGQSVNGKLMSSIYRGGIAYKILYYYSSVILIIIYIGAMISMLISMRNMRTSNLFILVFTIYLTGGVLFHLIWETKSQYVYPYVYLLLPLTAYGINWFQNKIRSRVTLKNK